MQIGQLPLFILSFRILIHTSFDAAIPALENEIESGDTFAKQRQLTSVGNGEMIAFRSAGAYGAVMASEYNSRPLIPEVLVDGDQFAVIRPRPSFDEMLNRDRLPEWMAG